MTRTASIAGWLESIGLEKYLDTFSENDIDMEVMYDLSEDDLKELGVSMGDRKRLLRTLRSLDHEAENFAQTDEHSKEKLPGLMTESVAERRQLSVMFCDLVGSTSLSEQHDPEVLRDILTHYRNTCAEMVGKYGGLIANYLGDGLLIYFGYPEAHEDDPQRAVRAGLAIIEAIRTSDSTQETQDINLAVRIGIATGIVVVGDIGDGEQREQMGVVGETPNLAARLQGLAEPGSIVISEQTKKLVEGFFLLENMGSHRLKGIAEPVPAFLVQNEQRIGDRYNTEPGDTMHLLVGRKEETGLLLKRWEQSRGAESQLVLLSAEAGIGKSRLVRDFQQLIKNELDNRILLFCAPYYQNSALFPVIDQLERALHFESNDDDSEKLNKLEALLESLELDIQKHAPVLAKLLSLSAKNRYPDLNVSPDQFKKKIFQTLVTIIRASTELHPGLLVVEDIHWIDPSTVEYLNYLVENLSSSRLMLWFTFRPEYEPPWIDYPQSTFLRLNRLTSKESISVISNITTGKELPRAVMEDILDKAGGVPLFVEELTKTVLESGVLEDNGDRYLLKDDFKTIAIPSSLHDSLMARLDRLGSAKEVAQHAAVIGRSFSYEMLKTIISMDQAELDSALERLIQSDLIYRRGLSPGYNYEFKHALAQDAAAQSLLKSNKQRIHKAIAQKMEEQLIKVGGIEEEVIAHHFTEGQIRDKAIAYWLQAGHKALTRSANLEAIVHLKKGLNLIQQESKHPELQKIELDYLLSLGTALISVKGFATTEIGVVYQRALDLCDQMDGPAELFPVTWGLWLHHQQCGNMPQAQALTKELVPLAKQLDDNSLKLQALHATWTTSFRVADYSSCHQDAQQGLKLYDPVKHRSHKFLYGGHDPGVCAHDHAAISLWLLGYPDQAIKHIDKSNTLAEDLSHPLTLSTARLFGAILYQSRGDHRLTRQYATATIEVCSEYDVAPSYKAISKVFLGWAMAEGDELKQGLDTMREGLEEAFSTGVKANRPYYLAVYANTCVKFKQMALGNAAIDEAVELIDQSHETTWEAEIYRAKGELLMLSPDSGLSEAESAFNHALELTREQGAKSLQLRAATSLGRLLRDRGEQSQANKLLKPVYDSFTEGLDTPDLIEASKLLETLQSS